MAKNEISRIGEITIRPATPADWPQVINLIEGLARFEKLDPPDAAARERLFRDAFSEHPRYEIVLAFLPGGEAAGYAFYLETYSSFLALPTLFLEDIFVGEEHRSKKIGLALFRHCVAEADRRACGRVEFMVLDWNVSARKFYERLGAEHLKEWCPYRLTREQFTSVLQKID